MVRRRSLSVSAPSNADLGLNAPPWYVLAYGAVSVVVSQRGLLMYVYGRTHIVIRTECDVKTWGGGCSFRSPMGSDYCSPPCHSVFASVKPIRGH